MKKIILSLLLFTVTCFAVDEAKPQGQSTVFKNLFSSGGSNSFDEPLPVEEAFKLAKPILVKDGIQVNFDIADGHYLYKDKFKFETSTAKKISLGEVKLRPGKIKDDPNFGTMEVFYHNLDFVIPVNNNSQQDINTQLTITFQGCAEKGICYPPTKNKFDFIIPAAMASFTTQAKVSPQPPQASFNLNQQDDDMVGALKSGNIAMIVMVFFVAGLLLAFTPCVFPMVPILSGIITGQDNVTTKKAFVLSLVYVLSMAFIYSLVGVASGLVGESIQAWFQKPWVLLTFGAIIVTMALSMFGLFEIQMPSFIQNKANDMSNRQKGGTLVGASIMGMLSALIVGACSTPVLAVAIGYIAQTADPVIGAVALFAMSLGMGLPLLIIGTSAGKLLPDKGMWMDLIKQSFGVLMLAVALYIIEPVLPTSVMMALWAALLIASGVYMGAFRNTELSGWQKLFKSFGLIFFILGVVLIIGMATGKGSLLAPLKGFASGSGAIQGHQGLEFSQIKGVKGFETELADAKQKDQFVMLDFYADWCKSCIELEEFTFNKDKVKQALNGVKLLQADVTLNDETDIELLKKFGINGPPAILFFAKSGNEMRDFRLNGFFDANDFSRHVNSVFGR